MRGSEKSVMLGDRHIPGIGLRIIKSAVATALCFVVAYFRQGDGMMFYSLIAALWCIQGQQSSSKESALQRFTGTIIGAVYGLLFLLMIRELEAWNVLPVEYGKETLLLQGAFVSVFVIIVLYTTVLLHKKQASYLSCVVYLSIAVAHVADANPYLFVWNRFLDTCIGLGIGIFVNDFMLPHHSK